MVATILMMIQRIIHQLTIVLWTILRMIIVIILMIILTINNGNIDAKRMFTIICL